MRGCPATGYTKVAEYAQTARIKNQRCARLVRAYPGLIVTVAELEQVCDYSGLYGLPNLGSVLHGLLHAGGRTAEIWDRRGLPDVWTVRVRTFA
jgi:hypothetical protein